MANLDGKTALITGGAVHLGRAIALAMASAGAHVAFTYLDSKDEANQTLNEIRQKGQQAVAVQCDLRDGKSIAAAVGAIQEQCGQIDVLVNNAGFFETVGFTDITEEQWDNMFAVNVRGPFLVTRHCVPALRSSQGRIINIGSVTSVFGYAGLAPYGASRGGVRPRKRSGSALASRLRSTVLRLE